MLMRPVGRASNSTPTGPTEEGGLPLDCSAAPRGSQAAQHLTVGNPQNHKYFQEKSPFGKRLNQPRELLEPPLVRWADGGNKP